LAASEQRDKKHHQDDAAHPAGVKPMQPPDPSPPLGMDHIQRHDHSPGVNSGCRHHHDSADGNVQEHDSISSFLIMILVGPTILLAGQGSQGADDGVEVHQAVLVLGRRHISRTLGGGCSRLQGLELLMGLEIGHDGVPHLCLGLQHGLAVVLQELLESRVLQPNVIFEPSVVEDVPLETTKETVVKAVSTEEVAEFLVACGRDAGSNAPADAEMRIELTDGKADLGALGGQLTLGYADIGPPADQILGHADGDLEGGGWNRLGSAEHPAHVIGRPAGKDRKSVIELLQGLLERGQGGYGIVEQGLGLVNVEGADLAAFVLRGGDLQALALELEVVFRHREPLPGGEDEQVVPGHLGDQRHRDTVISGDAGIEGCRRRFDLAPETAPDIDLPAEVEAEFVYIKVGTVGALPLGQAADILLLGKLAADGDQKLLARLEHPQPAPGRPGSKDCRRRPGIYAGPRIRRRRR
jgi:hypothetical protein